MNVVLSTLNSKFIHSSLALRYLKAFFFKQKTAYEMRLSLVGAERCIRDMDGREFTAEEWNEGLRKGTIVVPEYIKQIMINFMMGDVKSTGVQANES